MQLAKTTLYAIQVLIYMAERPGEVHSAAALHRKLGIPAQYLRQLLTHLANQGLVHATRGRTGGFVLRKKPKVLSVGQVMDAVGGRAGLQTCMLGFETCPMRKKCALHDAWQPVRKRINHILDTTTLSDLTGLKEKT